ncbi:uncharacterized protein LOC124155682 [Ischnura elegans]|uniref:uncharacterized protein LOC124155682 n=1 Tax=Ischnura elegans TaxID=197161 RepID=UPI001ED8A6CF|nr:uncharacterized protein LOC124155682 [Ischnura elegans]
MNTMVAPSDGFLRFICLDKQIRMFKDQCLQARSSCLQEFLLEIKQATEKQLLDAGFEQNPLQSEFFIKVCMRNFLAEKVLHESSCLNEKSEKLNDGAIPRSKMGL